MARLDRLEGAKGIAQTAAAIGREFSYSLLASVVGQNGMALQSPLAQLEHAQLVFRKGEPPEADYIFKHALVQDIAYESLAKSRRRALHQRIAEIIREHSPAIAEAQPEVIAHHFTQARLTDQAVEWWGKAGTLALRRSAITEAIAHFEKALDLANSLADAPALRLLRLRLQLGYGHALAFGRGYAAREAAAAFQRARELAVGVEDLDARFSANYGVWVTAYVSGDSPLAREVAEIFRDDALDSRKAGVGGIFCGQTDWFHGDFIEARRQFERVLVAHDPERHRGIDLRIEHDPFLIVKSYLACVLWPLGEVMQARAFAEEVMAQAIQSRHVLTIAHTYLFRFVVEMTCHDPVRVLPYAQACVALSREHDLCLFLSVGTFMLGWAQWHRGEREMGMAAMREGAAAIREQGLCPHIPTTEMLRAEALAEAGEVETGLAILDEQQSEIDRTGQRSVEADVHRTRGEVLLRRTPADHAGAEASFTRAIEIARQQQTKSFELRATLALAKLYHGTGRDKLVPELLIPAVGHFANGIELPELEEAHRLLTSIRAN
jgi:predicted ATPase